MSHELRASVAVTVAVVIVALALRGRVDSANLLGWVVGSALATAHRALRERAAEGRA